MSTIPLHPTRGLDPHLTYCPRCGGDAEELTVGAMRVGTITSGEQKGRKVYANTGRGGELARKLVKAGVIDREYDIDWREVEEREKVPASQPCKKCEDEMNEHRRIVEAGGIYFQCAECGKQGVIKNTAPVCDAVRRHAGIMPPKPVGISFQRCEEHGGPERAGDNV